MYHNNKYVNTPKSISTYYNIVYLLLWTEERVIGLITSPPFETVTDVYFGILVYRLVISVGTTRRLGFIVKFR